MNIVIIGYGIEGRSAHRFLKRKYSNAHIEIRDQKRQGAGYLEALEQFDMIVRSPGVKYLLPEIQCAEKYGVWITSVTKLFFRHAKGTIIGITGTKGKGTTATMLYQILKSAGKDAYLVGNIGKSMLDIIPKLTKHSISIVELSSFQLQDLDISPQVAIVLEIAPDHLNYHQTLHEYVSAKSNIAVHQIDGDSVFYIQENKYARVIAKKGHGKKNAVNFKNFRLFAPHDLKISGYYNFKNAVVASTAAQYLGVSDILISRAIRGFRGLMYHCEMVREINGIKFYNDSASTNPVSTIGALSAIPNPKILIMGGADKNFDYSVLKKPILDNHVKAVILFGANRVKIKRQAELRNAIFAHDVSDVLKRAMMLAQSGDTVLFSPASASFDMFENSKARGVYFTALVMALRE